MGGFDGVLPRLVKERGDDIDETVIGNLAYMVQQGRYDMGGLMRWVIEVPDRRARRRRGHTCQGQRRRRSVAGLAEAAVLETLRLDQATALHRVVLEELVFDGYRFPKDAFVKVPLREAHQDAEMFPEPERFKPCRFVGRTYSGDEYAPLALASTAAWAALWCCGCARCLSRNWSTATRGRRPATVSAPSGDITGSLPQPSTCGWYLVRS